MNFDVQKMDKTQLIDLIANNSQNIDPELTKAADRTRKEHYGKKVYLRGLIEFTNYCKNGCYYCGIGRENKNVQRYRLTKEDILNCCDVGWNLGFRTFVLQGGEDPYYDAEDRMVDIISSIRHKYLDCAITLSLGEKDKQAYMKYYKAGANRYLLRHETSNKEHYGKLHPLDLSLENRKNCLYTLKDIGFQVGAGFMVGSPYQTAENLAEDLLFLKDLQPHMVGIGPFIPQHDTVFRDKPSGTLTQSLLMLSLVRLMLPKVLLPSTTALGTRDSMGRELGIKAGANVVMPNLSPLGVRKQYSLYDNKICTGEEAAECIACISKRITDSGYIPDFSRGDHVDKKG